MSFDQSAIQRLSAFLGLQSDSSEIEQLTADASSREFFRIPWQGNTAIACVYPEPFDNTLPQIDTTKLFLAASLPVAEIFQIEFARGFLIHEDFGDRILRELMTDSIASDPYFDSAISLIAAIQNATALSFQLGSVASKLKFDAAKFMWELNFFKNHYFRNLRNSPLTEDIELEIDAEFRELSRELETFSTVLTHRDFHAANLMVVDHQLRIIDHQDARIGPASYDLVSLLLDRIDELPSMSKLDEKKKLLQAERVRLGLSRIKRLDYEFELVTIQRCLKAIGTFSNQAANFDKPAYIRFISPMFKAVDQACKNLGRFPRIRATVSFEAARCV